MAEIKKIVIQPPSQNLLATPLRFYLQRVKVRQWHTPFGYSIPTTSCRSANLRLAVGSIFESATNSVHTTLGN